MCQHPALRLLAGCAALRCGTGECCDLAGQAADEGAAHQPSERLNDKIPGIVFDSPGRPFLHGSMANECGVLGGKQLETRRAVRQPADIFGGTAHQAIWFADEPAMEAAANWLNEAEHQKLRWSGFEKRQSVRLEKIANKKSSRRSFDGVPRFLHRSRHRSGLRGQEAIGKKRIAVFKLRRVTAKIGLGEGRNPIAAPLG